MDSNKLSVPIAIILAGGLIAGSIYIVNSKKTPAVPAETSEAAFTYTISMPAVNDSDHIKGNPKAPIKIVEYSDTECPYCKRFQGTMNDIIDQYGKDGTVAWVYRHFPIASLHSRAPRESEATECVAKIGGEDAFWKYLDSIYATTVSSNSLTDNDLLTLASKVNISKDALTECLEVGTFKEKIAASVAEAQKAGARGTPYSVIEISEELNDDQKIALQSLNDQLTGGTEFVIRPDMINNNRISVYGAMPTEVMIAIIDILK